MFHCHTVCLPVCQHGAHWPLYYHCNCRDTGLADCCRSNAFKCERRRFIVSSFILSADRAATIGNIIALGEVAITSSERSPPELANKLISETCGDQMKWQPDSGPFVGTELAGLEGASCPNTALSASDKFATTSVRTRLLEYSFARLSDDVSHSLRHALRLYYGSIYGNEAQMLTLSSSERKGTSIATVDHFC